MLSRCSPIVGTFEHHGSACPFLSPGLGSCWPLLLYIHNVYTFFLLVVSKKFHRLSSFFNSFSFFCLFLLDYFIYPVFLVTDSFAHFSLLLKLLHSSVQCILYLYCFPNFIKLSVFFDNSLKFKRIILNYLTLHISSLL